MLPKDEKASSDNVEFYCPHCQYPSGGSAVCGDCGSLICRKCGTPLERISELGIG